MGLQLKVEQLEERHIEGHVRLSQSEYGKLAPVSQASHLRWKYLENPQGPSTGIHLYDGTELAGRAVALSRRFFSEGKSYRAAHVVDLLVKDDHRGMAALLLLMKGLKHLEGFDFYLIMSPNVAGAAVWEKLWKMEACFELDASVVPLRPMSLLHSLKNVPGRTIASVLDMPWSLSLGAGVYVANALFSIELEPRWPSPSEFDRLFLENVRGRTVGDRTGAYIQWRYQYAPVFQYEPLVVRTRGKLTGFLITRRATFDGMDCVFVVDAFCSVTHQGMIGRASRFMILRSLKSRAQIVMAIANAELDPLSELLRFPFLNVPARRLPRRLTVFAEWIRSPGFSINRKHLYLALGDSDVV